MPEKKVILIVTLGVFLLMLLLLGGIAALLFLHRRKVRLFSSQLEHVKAAYERELLRVQLEVQEQTLTHISREIHDNIGQKISLAKLNVATIHVPSDSKAGKKIDDAVDFLSQAMDDLRDLCRSLTLEELKGEGLGKAIETQVNHLRKAETYAIYFDIRGHYRYLDDQNEIILFRIFQEAINNIIRHAQATQIHIILDYDPTSVRLEVTDNGIGFSPSSPYSGIETYTAGSGLSNMKGRANLLAANLRIESQPGHGSSIIITVPTIPPSKHDTTRS